MEVNETCSDSAICDAAGKPFGLGLGGDGKDPLTKLLEDWGYEDLLPDNVIEWPTLPYGLHVAIGIYLFVSGEF